MFDSYCLRAFEREIHTTFVDHRLWAVFAAAVAEDALAVVFVDFHMGSLGNLHFDLIAVPVDAAMQKLLDVLVEDSSTHFLQLEPMRHIPVQTDVSDLEFVGYCY